MRSRSFSVSQAKASRLHRRQPLGITLGQLNCNTQVIVAVGRLSIIAKAYQSLDLVIVEINVDLKTTIRRAICTKKLHYARHRLSGFYIGLCWLVEAR